MPSFTSNQKAVPAVSGENTAGGEGLLGKSDHGGRGVAGFSDTWQGVYGHSTFQAGVVGESDQFDGGFFVSHADDRAGLSGHNDGGTAIWGGSKSGRGVAGFSDTWQGVYGHSISNAGVVGESDQLDGGFFVSYSNRFSGISGHNQAGGTAVLGDASTGRGVAGFSLTWQGVYGHSISNAGVVGESDQFDGGFFVSHNPNAAGVSGHNPGGLAGYFDGTVTVTGDLNLPGADCAEEFGVCGPDAEPGTVMVIAEDEMLHASGIAYDTRVAGVVSGGGDYQPGIVLDRRPQGSQRRRQLSLVGKVFCKVDAQYSPIRVGDMLTTSATPGHAMAVRDCHKAFGTVIGKALRSLDAGQGMIPILIALQ